MRRFGEPKKAAELISFTRRRAAGRTSYNSLPKRCRNFSRLVNEEEAHAVTPQLMQRALDKAIVRGHNVLYELLHRECQLPGEWEYVEGFKRLDAQAAPNGSEADEAIARSLRRRELMTINDDGWRLRVPLMLRWLRVRG